MIAERWTWKVKPGCWDEALQLLKAERDRRATAGPARIYYQGTPGLFGPLGRIVWEKEFEDEEARQKFWSDWWSEPESREFNKKFWDLMETDGSHELWGLA